MELCPPTWAGAGFRCRLWVLLRFSCVTSGWVITTLHLSFPICQTDIKAPDEMTRYCGCCCQHRRLHREEFGIWNHTKRVRVRAVPLASWAAVGSDFLSATPSPFPEPGLTSAASWLLDRPVVRLDRKRGDTTVKHQCLVRHTAVSSGLLSASLCLDTGPPSCSSEKRSPSAGDTASSPWRLIPNLVQTCLLSVSS